MAMINCRHFNGYKPCGKSETCDSLCPSLSVASTRILIIHLEALGAVVRSTSLLPAIKRKFPDSHITWVTQKPADQLLMNNPFVDRVLTTETGDLLSLSALEFDVAFAIDKGLKTAGVLKQTRADLVYGFQVDARTGAVLPATPAATELWELGLSNHKKFFVNTKPETRLTREALELPQRPVAADGNTEDEYILPLTAAERRLSDERRQQWLGEGRWLVGLNTGCANVIPFKKLSIEMHRQLVQRLSSMPGVRVVLLGGRDEELRNQRIAHGLDCIQSPTGGGLRDGISSLQACDVVVTGDSLGMHLAIALKKWTVAWFGPTCAHEIDLYGRGTKVLSRAGCSPCWKRSCDRQPMCYDLVALDDLIDGVILGLNGQGLGSSNVVSKTPDSVHSHRLHRRPHSGDPDPEASSSP